MSVLIAEHRLEIFSGVADVAGHFNSLSECRANLHVLQSLHFDLGFEP